MLDDLIAALERSDPDTAVTSIRQGPSLREATKVAVSMGWASSPTEGLNRAVREQLEAFALRTALEEHLQAHPDVRPSLAEVAVAVAELLHSPLADQPALVRRAAKQIVKVKPDADAHDVFVWALSLQAQASARVTA